MVAQLDADFVEGLQTLVKWLVLVHFVLESDFACVQIKPLNVILGEKHLVSFFRGLPFGLVDAVSVEFVEFYRVGRERFCWFVVVTAASRHCHVGDGYRHHPSNCFDIFHLLPCFEMIHSILIESIEPRKDCTATR